MELTFNQYIAKFHPDPDAIIIQDKNNSIGYEVNQITKLAENYANYRKTYELNTSNTDIETP